MTTLSIAGAIQYSMIQTNTRYIALDVFRGLAIALMILVNTPGSWSNVYAPLLHSEWNGLTPTDLVFPFFLYIVGASMFFAFRTKGLRITKSVLMRVVRRSAILFLLGLLLNAYNMFLLDLPDLRIMGVLQRISLCYLIGSILVLTCKTKMVYLLTALALLGYYAFFMLFGGTAPFSIEGSVVAMIDQAIIGKAHMWQLQGVAFEPEGLMSTIPATVTLLFGFETARKMSFCSNSLLALRGTILYGALSVLLGCLLSDLMPINKNIWSVSFVFVGAGCALFVLALCVLIADVLRWSALVSPLEIYGTNPLFVYCLSWLFTTFTYAVTVDGRGTLSLVKYLWLGMQPELSPQLASFSFAFVHVVLFWLVSWVLYYKKIFIKI